MIQLSPTLYYILLEAIGLLTVVVAVMGGFALRRRRQRQQALLELVGRLKDNGPQRIETLRAALKAAGGASDERTAALADAILKAETGLYRFLIQALLKADGKSLLALDVQVEALIKEVAAAPVAAPSPIAAVAGSGNETAKIIDAIRSEQAKVQTELKATRDDLKKAIAGISAAAVTARPAQPERDAPPGETNSASAVPTAAPDKEMAIEELDLDFSEQTEESGEPQEIVDLGSLDSAAEVEPPAQPASASMPSQELDTSGIAEIPDDLLFGEAGAAEPELSDKSASELTPIEDTEPAAPTVTEHEIDIAAAEEPQAISADDQIIEAAPPPAADLDVAAAPHQDEIELASSSTPDPDDILDQIARSDVSATDTIALSEAAEVNQAQVPATANEPQPTSASTRPAKPGTAGDLDPDEILDSLLSDSTPTPQPQNDTKSVELIPDLDAKTAASVGEPGENKKNNDIVSDGDESGQSAADATTEPLIPDPDTAPARSESRAADKSKAKTHDKEALIAELEDLLG